MKDQSEQIQDQSAEVEEKQVESDKKQPEMGLETIKWLFNNILPKVATGTAPHNPARKRGVGVTRKNKEQTKKSRKIAKNSRRRNRQ